MWHHDPTTRLIRAGDANALHDVWQSDLFKAALGRRSNGLMAVVERFNERPFWLYTPRHAYERTNFSIWFGNAIGVREYKNPLLNDLYLFHDMLHSITFVDNPNDTASGWRLRMRSNEIAVSLETEVVLYARAPELRAKSFGGTIWADRWNDAVPPPLDRRTLRFVEQASWEPYEKALFEAVMRPWPVAPLPDPYRDAYRRIWWARRAVTHEPTSGDEVEENIAYYERSAEAWYNVWEQEWRAIEHHRQAFERLCNEGKENEAIALRYAHWEKVSNNDGVPYGDLCRASLASA